jgi:hypothetical protein
MTENIDSTLRGEVQTLMVSAGFQKYQWSEGGSGDAPEAEQVAGFLHPMLSLLNRVFRFGQQSMNLTVRFVADCVNLRTKSLPRSCRILVEQCLNPIVVLVKQRPDLLLLFRSQIQFFRKASKFLVDRLRRLDMLKFLARTRLLCPIVLS